MNGVKQSKVQEALWTRLLKQNEMNGEMSEQFLLTGVLGKAAVCVSGTSTIHTDEVNERHSAAVRLVLFTSCKYAETE